MALRSIAKGYFPLQFVRVALGTAMALSTVLVLLLVLVLAHARSEVPLTRSLAMGSPDAGWWKAICHLGEGGYACRAWRYETPDVHLRSSKDVELPAANCDPSEVSRVLGSYGHRVFRIREAYDASRLPPTALRHSSSLEDLVWSSLEGPYLVPGPRPDGAGYLPTACLALTSFHPARPWLTWLSARSKSWLSSSKLRLFSLAFVTIVIACIAIGTFLLFVILALARLGRVLWLWRRSNRLLLEPGSLQRAGVPIACVITDLHITAGVRPPIELEMGNSHWPTQPLPTGDDILARATAAIAAATQTCRTLVVSGDITDDGSAAQWTRARSLLATNNRDLLIVGGNHDVHINPDDETLETRRQRMDANLSALQPAYSAPAYARTLDGVLFVLVDSNRYASHHILSNAVGLVGATALGSISRSLATHDGPCVVVLHHHVVRGRGERFDYQDPLLRIVDAIPLLRVIAKHRSRGHDALLVHGHRHVLLVGELAFGGTTIKVAGLPSTTMGDQSSGRLDAVVRYGAITQSADRQLGFELVTVPFPPT